MTKVIIKDTGANFWEKEKTILKDIGHSVPSLSRSDSEGVDDTSYKASETELCCICFDQVCTIEVQDCGHQMCAQCTLALCCHNKPSASTAPLCPFCRSTIAHLVALEVKSTNHDLNPKLWQSRKARKCSEGSCSVMGLTVVPSVGKVKSRGSGRISVDNGCIDKS